MNNPLLTFLKQLDLEKSVFFHKKEHGQSFGNFGSDIQKKLDAINPDAYYIFNNKPFILFFDLSNTNSQKEKSIHKQVWSFDNSPITFIIKDTEIKVFNAFNYIKEKNGNSGLEEIKLNEEERKEKFSFWNLQSGYTWKWLQEEYLGEKTKKDRKKRVNERLFQNIKEVRETLIQSYAEDNDEEASSKANSLILRLIFIRYLIDRGVIIDNTYINGNSIKAKRLCFSKLISEPDRLNNLFKVLNNKFNGVLFKDIETPLSHYQAKSLSNIFKGETPEEGSLFFNHTDFYFEIFDFSIIPVEVISGIYESLISPETRKLDSAVYTPSFLVEYILEDTVQKHLDSKNTSECKIFEVAVGSGIFLVQSLRKMIDKEIEISKKVSKDTFNKRIREIAKSNLFGIDINKEALKVTCFSLYIALLDYQNPKEIDKYEFPNFLNENLFNANFFDVEHEFNTVLKETVKPDFILGNPPWKSNKDPIHIKWINSNNKTIGRFEIAQSFLLRSKDFMQPSTKAALIITSTIFYNTSKTTKYFKKEFLTSFCIEKFFDLSPVRRLIFEEKNSPASVVYYKQSNGNDFLNNTILHQSIKSNIFLKHFKLLVLEKQDQKRILQKHFIENTWMFKVALYGNTLDFKLLKKIENLSPKKISDFIDNNIIYGGAGIHKGKKGKYTSFESILNLPIIENDEIEKFYSTSHSNNKITEDDLFIKSGRNLGMFQGIQILLKEQAKNESEIVVAITDKEYVFRSGAFAISSKEKPDFIYALFSVLISNLYQYFIFISSGSWGTSTRPQIRWKEEFLSFPLIQFSSQEELKVIGLIHQFLKPYRVFYNSFNIGEPQKNISILDHINILIEKFYEINSYEKDLIDYTLSVSRYQFQESKQNKFLKKVDGDLKYLEQYANIYLQEFQEIYEDEFMQVEIFSLGYFIAMNFILLKEKPTKKIIHTENSKEEEVLKKLANTLSISQITSTEDPSKNLYIQKDIKGFERNSFYIIKPNEFKSWHRAMAWYDVAEFKEAIENAEINHLKLQNIN